MYQTIKRKGKRKFQEKIYIALVRQSEIEKRKKKKTEFRKN